MEDGSALDIVNNMFFEKIDIASSDINKICFQIELAHWYYIDELVPKYKVPKLKLNDFFELVFRNYKKLKTVNSSSSSIYQNWLKFKTKIPVYGAIMIDKNMNKVILVQSYNSRQWAFPQGKINDNEKAVDCAVREVFEETGLDIKGKIDDNNYISVFNGSRHLNLFIVFGINEGVQFKIQTKNEIRDVQWYNIEENMLITSKSHLSGSNKKNLFMVFKELGYWFSKNDFHAKWIYSFIKTGKSSTHCSLESLEKRLFDGIDNQQPSFNDLNHLFEFNIDIKSIVNEAVNKALYKFIKTTTTSCI